MLHFSFHWLFKEDTADGRALKQQTRIGHSGTHRKLEVQDQGARTFGVC